MLEPREADIPALFLVLVVLPLVAYFLLGKWSEVSKKREKISLLAHLAAEEAFRAESMASATVIPGVPIPKKGLHVCARCFGPATTCCSRCKAVRYWYIPSLSSCNASSMSIGAFHDDWRRSTAPNVAADDDDDDDGADE